MNTKSCALKFAGSVLALMLYFEANAWMDPWAPEFKATAANVEALPKVSVSNYVCTATEGGEFRWEYSEGYAIDLNDDGTKDQVFIIPWMGNGLGASGYDVHFMVSDGAKGRKKTVIEGYGVSKSDFVKVKGKTYFRHSKFFEHFEKSEHNHWVYQRRFWGEVPSCDDILHQTKIQADRTHGRRPEENRCRNKARRQVGCGALEFTKTCVCNVDCCCHRRRIFPCTGK